eukprot:symbB.v1.2.021675.t1/scaffold1887.1/size97121/2
MGKDLSFRNGSWNHMAKTKIFPFRTGCPEICHDLRVAAGSTLEDTYFRTGTLWSLSGRQLFQNTSDMEKKIRAESLPEPFGNAFDSVEAEIMRELRELPFSLEHVMFFHQQRAPHVSLSYDCCFTKEEAMNFQLIFRRWLGQTRFNLHLHFTHLECWLERFNSLTIVAMVDPAAQIQLLRWNHELNQELLRHGIPVLVHREEQMPFHMTVLGVYLGNEFSPASRDRMEIFGEAICEKVSKVSATSGSIGTSAADPVILNFVPEVSKPKPLVFAASTIFSAAAGLFIFTLQGRVSATTTQIASLCYKLATTVLSLLVFPQARKDLGWMAILGYSLSTVSVALYAFLPSKRVANSSGSTPKGSSPRIPP